MKVKLLKAFKVGNEDLPAESIVEVDDETAQPMISAGYACDYTVEAAKQEQVSATKALAKAIAIEEKKIMSVNVIVKDEVKITTVSEARKYFRDQKDLAAKALITIGARTDEGLKRLAERDEFSAVVAKAMSEAGSGVGDALVVEAIAQIMGGVSAEAVATGDCRVFTLPESSGSMKVPVAKSDWLNGGNAPAVAAQDELPTLTASELAFGAIDVTPKNQSGVVSASIELCEDVPALQGEITRFIVMKEAVIEDGLAFTGAAAGSGTGFLGVLNAGSNYVATQSIGSAGNPTLAELQGFVAGMAPFWIKDAAWYVGNKVWANIKANTTSIVTAANIAKMLIDISADKPSLLGLPVKIVAGMPANKIVLANMRNYALVRKAGAQILFSNQALYLNNAYAWRLNCRVGGCVGAAAYTLADSSKVASFVVPA